jgi:N-acetylglucosaminyldiphosphoundecaprenol N-acetyl-beta-D-mannosaminyltransferase
MMVSTSSFPMGVVTTALEAPADGLVAELNRARVSLAGTLIDRIDLPTVGARLRAFLEAGSPHHVMTVNLDYVNIATHNAAFRQAIDEADLAVADGMPLVWVSRLGAAPLAQRITGFHLVEQSCRLAVEAGRGVFLLGSAPNLAAAAADGLRTRYPGLSVDAYSPPFGPLPLDETDRMLRAVRRADPDFLFVALGAPRQDLWIRDNLERLGVPVSIGVGCVLDVLAGAMRRAPVWMQQSGLEWAFRLLQEPRRLAKRYFIDDLPVFALLLLKSVRRGGTESLCRTAAPRVLAH